MTHSFLPPSGAASWKECAMWPTMNKLYPQDDTPENMEGNAAHWLAWEMYAARFHGFGAVAPNGIMITEEMIEGAELVLDTINARMPGWKIEIEQQVAIPSIHKDCFGTPDIWGFDSEKFVLEVLDYKFGHRFVDEFENDQGIGYISGILSAISGRMGMHLVQLEEMVTVNFTVIQPRCFYKGNPVRTWIVRADKLRVAILNLARAAAVAYDPNPVAITNLNCGDCPGRHACAALQEAAYNDCEYSTRSVPVELTPAAAGLELRIMERSLERLTARVEGMRESVLAHIRQGHAVPWYRTEQGYGQTKWTIPTEQVVALGTMMGVNLSKNAVKTPNQAKKDGIDESVIKAYSITPPGGLKLIPTNPSDARRVFGSN